MFYYIIHSRSAQEKKRRFPNLHDAGPGDLRAARGQGAAGGKMCRVPDK
jgi:hypothetical protein